MNHLLEAEGEHRRLVWEELRRSGGPSGVKPELLRRLSIYGGMQGIWVDKQRTAALTQDGSGVAVGLLHTGSSYADDLSEDGVIYHYPTTRRGAGRDANEVAAVKAAMVHHLPVFIIAHPKPGSPQRNVMLGWVAGHDDLTRQFLVLFGEKPPAPVPDADTTPFELTERAGATRTALVRARPGQQQFAFAVFRRYGPVCMACGIELIAVLDAAHLRPKAHAGSDDPRNGMVLCATHHRAYDAGLFNVEPGTHVLHPGSAGPSLAELRITRVALTSMTGKLPHEAALCWRWRKANGAAAGELGGA